jgi:hypothetical protein
METCGIGGFGNTVARLHVRFNYAVFAGPDNLPVLIGLFGNLALKNERLFTGPETEGSIPSQQAQLRSNVNLPWHWQWTTSAYFVGRLAAQNIPSYTRLDTNLAGNHHSLPVVNSPVAMSVTKVELVSHETDSLMLPSQPLLTTADRRSYCKP